MFERLYPRQRPGIETHVLPDGSCLLFDPEQDQGHALNVTGALVWDYCDGERSGADIARELASLVPSYSSAEQDTERLLHELAQRGLLLPPADATESAR